MSFCSNCGKEILEGAVFCGACGTPVAEKTAPPVTDTAPNFSGVITEDTLIKEEQKFLDDTHNLLRWERKAWSIYGKFYLIFGIICASIFGFIAFMGFIEVLDGSMYGEDVLALTVGIMYSVFLGGTFIGFGILHKKVADKMPIYINSLYEDFSITNARSGNVGMMVFAIIFGGVHTIFFIINFVRLKAGSRVIERILARQEKNV